MKINKRIEKLAEQIQKDVYEKEEIFLLALLAMLSGESIFLLGKPGVAKSLVARRLKFAFNNGSIFEYLMSRFSTPEEIFGPISIQELQKGIYKRNIENYLPASDIVFLDEIWKAGPSIQNTLLTIINEKLFRNAGENIKVPMKLLISASNELPEEGQGLEALYDRFIIRYIAKGLQDQDNFNNMISASTSLDVKVDKELQITHKEFNLWTKELQDVKMGQNTFDFITKFRAALDYATDGQAYISDRRWKKIANLMKASAYYNGRTTVDKPDWLIIPYCIWDNEEQEQEYREIFVELYYEELVSDIEVGWEALKGELQVLKDEYALLLENISEKSSYTNIFSGEVEGNFFRLLDSERLISFITIEDYNEIHRNKEIPTFVNVYHGEDLNTLLGIDEVQFSWINDRRLLNLTTGVEVPFEVQNSKNLNLYKKEKEEIDEMQQKVDDMTLLIIKEYNRLKKEGSQFFPNDFNLALDIVFEDAIKEQEIRKEIKAEKKAEEDKLKAKLDKQALKEKEALDKSFKEKEDAAISKQKKAKKLAEIFEQEID